MTNAEKEFMERQSKYISLLNKLTKIRLAGEQPSEELVKQTRELGQAARIPDFLLKLF